MKRLALCLPPLLTLLSITTTLRAQKPDGTHLPSAAPISPDDHRTAISRASMQPELGAIGADSSDTGIFKANQSIPELGAIGAVFSDGGYGTGFLADNCHVLTNAHVVFHVFDSEQILDTSKLNLPENKRVNFAAGYSTETKTGFAMKFEGKVVQHGSPDGSDFELNSDWAVIKLDIAPSSISPIPIEQVPDLKIINLKVSAFGFPGDRTGNGKDFSSLYGNISCTVLGAEPDGHISHTCQSTRGQSGTPLIRRNKSGKIVAVGMMQGHEINKTGLEEATDFDSARPGIHFDSGKDIGPDLITEGDKIMEAIRSTPCSASASSSLR